LIFAVRRPGVFAHWEEQALNILDDTVSNTCSGRTRTRHEWRKASFFEALRRQAALVRWLWLECEL